MSEKKPHSSSIERAVIGYLTPRNHSMFTRFVEQNNIGKSEAINKIVKEFFDTPKKESKHNYWYTSFCFGFVNVSRFFLIAAFLFEK